jgi:hypothetical protein
MAFLSGVLSSCGRACQKAVTRVEKKLNRRVGICFSLDEKIAAVAVVALVALSGGGALGFGVLSIKFLASEMLGKALIKGVISAACAVLFRDGIKLLMTAKEDKESNKVIFSNNLIHNDLFVSRLVHSIEAALGF